MTAEPTNVVPFPECQAHAAYCLMAPTIKEHAVAIDRMREDHSRSVEKLGDKIDGLKSWLMGALLSSLLCLLAAILTAIFRK